MVTGKMKYSSDSGRGSINPKDTRVQVSFSFKLITATRFILGKRDTGILVLLRS